MNLTSRQFSLAGVTSLIFFRAMAPWLDRRKNIQFFPKFFFWDHDLMNVRLFERTEIKMQTAELTGNNQFGD